MTTLRAGLALKIISSLVNGLMPLRALVAGLRWTETFIMPGTLNAPQEPFLRSTWIMSPMTSKTWAASFLEMPTWSAMMVRTSDLVRGFSLAAVMRAGFLAAVVVAFFGAAFFLVVFLAAGLRAAVFLAGLRAAFFFVFLAICNLHMCKVVYSCAASTHTYD